MRQATQNTHWLLSKDGTLEGISCGSDCATEHESGIDGLRLALGCKTKFENGLPDRCIQQQPPVLQLFEKPGKSGEPTACLVMGDVRYTTLGESSDPIRQMGLDRTDAISGDPNLSVAWDSDGVVIYATGFEGVNRVREFHRLVSVRDVALGNAFTRATGWHPKASGLVFVKASAVPPELAERALAEDRSNLRLRQAAAKLNLEPELRQAGCRWFALSPRWADETEQSLVFWLNPYEQQDHHAGWFTPEDLRQWAKGYGPVMIDKPLRALAKTQAPVLEQLGRNIRKAGYRSPNLTVVWDDPNKKTFAIRVTHYGSPTPGQPQIDEGIVPLATLQTQFPDPPRAKAAGRKKKP